MGPIGLKAHLAPFMADHPWSPPGGRPPQWARVPSPQRSSARPASRRFRGCYITMMVVMEGATEVAILNANYVASPLAALPGALHRQPGVPMVHPRHPPDQAATGISEVDIAKRA